MVLTGLAESGAEDWLCPECGRHMLMRWPPRFEVLVLDDGDPSAVHTGAKGGALMRGVDLAHVPSADVPASEQEWLRSNGIDWDDDIAS
jgi:hypothetical protein